MIRKINLIMLFAAGLICHRTFAQTDNSVDSAVVKLDTVPRKYPAGTKGVDLVDVFRTLSKKNQPSQDTTEKIDQLHFSLVPAVGYTLSTGWAGIIAGNVAFYLDDPKTTNISSLTTSIVYSQYSQLTVPLIANIWTKNNNYNIITDWRYYKYPQDTYGLGGHSSITNADQIDYSHIRLHQAIMKKVTNDFYAGAGYFLDWHYNIEEGGQANGDSSDASKYGLGTKSVSSGLVVNLLYDNRQNSINPQGGLYANVLYRPNLTLLGSDNNWQSLTIDIRKYMPFPAGSKNILAFWNYDWLTLSGKPPYMDLPSTGWDTYNNTGRGYIQSRFRGENMLYLETEYRFGITRNGLFGAVVFANAESFSEYPSKKFEVISPGVGLGVRIKVNKKSDSNICIDYGFGTNGSRGLFVNVGEVF